MAQLREVEIRPRQNSGNPRAVQKVGVALRVRQDRGRFPVRLSEKPVGGAGATSPPAASLSCISSSSARSRSGGRVRYSRTVASARRFFSSRQTQNMISPPRMALASSFQCASETWPGASITSASVREAASSPRSRLSGDSRSSGL